MITSRQYVQQITEITGFEESEHRTVDVALSNAGMRRKSSGRSYVQMSTEEALCNLLGVMGAPVKANPANYIRDVSKFKLMSHGIDILSGNVIALPKYIGLTAKELGELTLLEVLVTVCGFLATLGVEGGAYFGARVWIEVQTNGPVSIHIDGTDFKGEAIFVGATDTTIGDGQRIARVSNHTLSWIGQNTEAEADEN